MKMDISHYEYNTVSSGHQVAIKDWYNGEVRKARAVLCRRYGKKVVDTMTEKNTVGIYYALRGK